MSDKRYSSLGASATKAGLHKQLKSIGLEDVAGTFCKLNSDLAGDAAYASFLHSDGAGTKCIVAYLLYKATGETRYFAGLAQDALVMNLDDVLCVGAPQKLLLTNTIARNAHIIPDEALGAIIERYQSIIEELQRFGLDIELAGGESGDYSDTVRTLTVEAVLGGRIRKADIIHPNNIVPGDIIVGLSSTGKSSYEQAPNSGIGSNGLTLARHVLLSSTHAKEDPEIVASALKKEVAYTGRFRVTDVEPTLQTTVGEALLSPTRTYAPVLLPLYQELSSKIHGVIHLTGGGLTKVIRFGQGNLYVKDHLFPVPPLFSLIQSEGNVDWKEMYQVFNMGQRIEVYVAERDAPTVLAAAKAVGVDAQPIGHVEKAPSDKNLVRVKANGREFDYTLSA